MSENENNKEKEAKQVPEQNQASDHKNEDDPGQPLSGSSLRDSVLNSMKSGARKQQDSQKTEQADQEKTTAGKNSSISSKQKDTDATAEKDSSENLSVRKEDTEEASRTDELETTVLPLGSRAKPDQEGHGSVIKKKTGSEKEAVRMKEDHMVSKIVIIVVSVLIVTIAISGFSFYRYWQAGLKPLDSKDSQLVQVEIPIGSSNKEIGSILEESKVIKSGFVFTYYVKMNNISDFQGGYYQMSANMTLKKISKLLQKGGTAEPEAIADAKITIPEGQTIEQIADTLSKKTDYSKKKFLALMKDKTFVDQMAEKYPVLLANAKDAQNVRYYFEGYLFPATYNYYKKESLETFVEKMLAKTDSVMSSYYDTINANDQLDIQKVLTLASLVEKEGVTNSDRRNIAQVFFNRLAANMPLQSDISVLYALNEHKTQLSNDDTKVDSPYNLYINTGYGPGPFNNPGETSIKAVLDPKANDYLYFLADVKDGKVYFSKTYEEHLALKEKYIDN